MSLYPDSKSHVLKRFQDFAICSKNHIYQLMVSFCSTYVMPCVKTNKTLLNEYDKDMGQLRTADHSKALNLSFIDHF